MKKRDKRKKQRKMKANAIKTHERKIKSGDKVIFDNDIYIVRRVYAGIVETTRGLCVDEKQVKLLKNDAKVVE